jgi:hypothetical protein
MTPTGAGNGIVASSASISATRFAAIAGVNGEAPATAL